MATLVLTAVGTALGGPIGGALGALLGQSADAALFAPRARQGPRLTDFKVQTSSYGDRIPRLYGTMRVAGTVIWATDLVERRSKRSNGKGRPKTIEYQYSASFAVALSSRPILAIRRIWADGRILRDSTGTMAEAGALRVHDGGADQAPDPLIASHVGADRCSAFRGIAYALFEDLDLTAFGNRIPQLTFEVAADDGDVAPGLIVSDLTGLAVPPDGTLLGGFAAVGERRRDVLAPLIEWGDLALRRAGAALHLAGPDSGGAAGADPAAARVHAAQPLVADESQRRPWAKVPDAVRLRHYDPARDYQTSEQRAAVAGGSGAARAIDLPSALTAARAQGAAQRLAMAAANRRRMVLCRGGLGAMTLPLGAPVTLALADDHIRRWQVSERQLGDDGVRLTLVELEASGAASAPAAADGGTALTSGDLPASAAMLAIFDVPGDGDAARTAPLRLMAAAGPDPAWRGADLWWVAAAGAEPEPLGRIAAAAALGTSLTVLPPGITALIDRAQPLDIQLLNDAMTLQNVPLTGLASGANAAMLGDELIQFERAQPLGAARWRLTGLLRGRGGTGTPAGGHPIGAPFVLVDDAALLPLPDAMALRSVGGGAAIDWQVRGTAVMHQTALPPGQRALVPLSPVHGRAVRLADGRVQLRWTARSRAGAAWRDGVDGPVGEAQSHFVIRFTGADGSAQTAEASAPEWLLPATGFLPGSTAWVEQRGDYAVSPPLAIALPAA